MGAPIWEYGDTSGHVPGAELVGFKAEASDGHIGKIDKHSEDVGRSYIVVDTGPWIFGRRVLLPAGVVSRIDVESETVDLSATKAEIKASPDLESGKYAEEDMPFMHLIEQYYANRHI